MAINQSRVRVVNSKCVAVVGLGYVGLPLALAFAEAGFDVVGFERDPAKVDALLSGFSHLQDVSPQRLLDALARGMEIHGSPESISRADLVIVAVPTPLDDSEGKPDLKMVLSAAEDIRGFLKRGAAVCLESTVAPGTTEGPFLGILSAAGFVADVDFFLGFSPERINPGMPQDDFLMTPKLISGISEGSLRVIAEFYSSVFDSVVPVRGIREAEFAKLLENAYRLVNISFVNELAFASTRMGIDFGEVIRAAATKPFGFQPFFPTAGAGGHCIPVDSVYLQNALEVSTGLPQEILATAIRINDNAVERFVEEIIGGETAVRDKSILVAGLAYKRGVSDMRNSAALKLIGVLGTLSAKVSVFDEIVGTVSVDGVTYQSIDLESQDDPFDLVVLMHDFADDDQRRLLRLATRGCSASGFFGEIPSSMLISRSNSL